MTGDPTNASALAPGYKLDRYELLCPIAEGGMASVWVARQRGKHGFEKLVAIKTILPKFAGDVRFQDMFLDEARIASRIEHVNVAQIFDLGEEHDILYLAMEYVEGDALSKINRACAKKGLRIPTGVILRVLADTCAGLHEAHEMRDATGRKLEIVHRDVSPHNILVSTKGVAKLIDFGIATAQSRAGAETSSGVLKGKIQYMAPEQALGQKLDRRADVWAIGAVLYSLLSGRPPYDGDNPLATLNLLASGRPPMPLPSAVHPSIAAIVRRSLSFDPAHRQATAADLRDAIERAMISSRCTETTADVAAFAAEHIGDRVEKRRHSVDLALAAALERQRAEERLRPPPERRSTSVLPGPSASSPPWPPPSSGALPSPVPIAAATAAEAPAAKPPSLEMLARLTPRLSEPPAQASSYATLGSAALDAPPPAKSRKGAAALGGALLAIAIAAGGAFTAFRTHPQKAPSPASPTMLVTPSSPTRTTATTTAAANSGESWGILPTIAASSLPKAAAPVFSPASQPRRSPPWSPASKPKRAADSVDESSSAEPPVEPGAERAATPPTSPPETPPPVDSTPPAPTPSAAPTAPVPKKVDDGF